MAAKNTYQLTTQELTGRRIGNTLEDQLEWFLWFVNQGTWQRTKEGPGLGSFRFTTGLQATHDDYKKLLEEVEAFCGESWGLNEKPLDKMGLVDLQKTAAQILLGLAKKGVVSQDVAKCKLVLFPDHEGRVYMNIAGDRNTRFIFQISKLLEAIDLTRLRSCPECLKVFYTTRRPGRPQIYCSDRCSGRVRARRYLPHPKKKRGNFPSRVRP